MWIIFLMTRSNRETVYPWGTILCYKFSNSFLLFAFFRFSLFRFCFNIQPSRYERTALLLLSEKTWRRNTDRRTHGGKVGIRGYRTGHSKKHSSIGMLYNPEEPCWNFVLPIFFFGKNLHCTPRMFSSCASRV